jgi:hypothetical protein
MNQEHIAQLRAKVGLLYQHVCRWTTRVTTGLASAVGAGQTTIEAASGAINGSTTLTVTGAFVFDRQPEDRALPAHGDAAERRHGADYGWRGLQRYLSQRGAVQSRDRGPVRVVS